MARLSRLEAVATGTITGASNEITLYHGLQLYGNQVAPTEAHLHITSTQENGGPAAAVATNTINIDVLPVNGNTITCNGEVWTWGAARTTPFTVAIDTTAGAPGLANCESNFVAAFNLDTAQRLVADVNGGQIRVRGAAYPGGTAENGPRTGGCTRVGGYADWAQPNLNLCGGAGETTGTPSFSEIARTTDMVRWIVRGMRSTDTLTYRAEAKYVPLSSLAVPTLRTAADGVMVLGSNTFTSATGAFLVNGVQPGDILTVNDVGTPANNGAYPITAVTATTLTLSTTALPAGARASQAALDYVVGPSSTVTDHYANLNQVAFSEPSADTCGPTTEAVTMSLPAGAISLAELNLNAVQDIGSCSVGWVRWAAAQNNADTITIGGTEVWTGQTPGPIVLPFRYLCNVGTAADCLAFVTAVNLEATSLVYAIDIGGDVAALIRKTTGADLALAESTASARTIVSAAAMTGRRVAADIVRGSRSYTVTAADVTTWAVGAGVEVPIAAFPSATTPTLESFTLRTAAGIFKAINTMGLVFRQSGANWWSACVVDPVAVAANTDIITITVSIQ